jgi:hypothetical protein
MKYYHSATKQREAGLIWIASALFAQTGFMVGSRAACVMATSKTAFFDAADR